MKIDEKIISIMKKDSYKAFRNNEIPVSAVVVDKEGNIISHACNARQKSCDVLGHAEIIAIRKAGKKLNDWRLNGYKMFVSLEPCKMCSMVIKESRLDEVYYFVVKSDDETNVGVEVAQFLVEGHDSEKEYFSNLLTSFFDNMR